MDTNSRPTAKSFSAWLARQLTNACQQLAKARTAESQHTYRTWGECSEVATFVLQQRADTYQDRKRHHLPEWKPCAQETVATLSKLVARANEDWSQLEYRQTLILNQRAIDHSTNLFPIFDLWQVIAAEQCGQMRIRLKHDYDRRPGLRYQWKEAADSVLKTMPKLAKAQAHYMRGELEPWVIAFRYSQLQFQEQELSHWHMVARQCEQRVDRQRNSVIHRETHRH